ncbi:MAG: hypothetical protein MZV70_16660, partial [Desulfobacterales bacterium]|nr:hypothetical protein [Desulfobacterales bacterium]
MGGFMRGQEGPLLHEARRRSTSLQTPSRRPPTWESKAAVDLLVADDPGAYSSQNEQDSRLFARFAKIPCLEPSDSQEAKDMVELEVLKKVVGVFVLTLAIRN